MGDLHEFISTMRFAWPSQLWPCCKHSSIMCACEPMFALVEFQHVVKKSQRHLLSVEPGPKQRTRVRDVVCVQINTTSSGTSLVGGAAAQAEEQPGEREEEPEARGEGDGRWDRGQSENASVINEMRQEGDESQRQAGMVGGPRCCQLGDWWKLWQCKMHQLKFLVEVVGVMWRGERAMERENWRGRISRLRDGAWSRKVQYLEFSVIRARSSGGHAQLIARSQNGRCDLEVTTGQSQ